MYPQDTIWDTDKRNYPQRSVPPMSNRNPHFNLRLAGGKLGVALPKVLQGDPLEFPPRGVLGQGITSSPPILFSILSCTTVTKTSTSYKKLWFPTQICPSAHLKSAIRLPRAKCTQPPQDPCQARHSAAGLNLDRSKLQRSPGAGTDAFRARTTEANNHSRSLCLAF